MSTVDSSSVHRVDLTTSESEEEVAVNDDPILSTEPAEDGVLPAPASRHLSRAASEPSPPAHAPGLDIVEVQIPPPRPARAETDTESDHIDEEYTSGPIGHKQLVEILKDRAPTDDLDSPVHGADGQVVPI